MSNDWQWTPHAIARAKTRIPHLDPNLELAQSRPAGKAAKRKIRTSCPYAAERYMQGFNGRYYMVSPRGTVFVVSAPDTVVTVFTLDRP